MKKRDKRKSPSGRNLALTIILGVFIAIMIITLFNLIVTYFYEEPKYEDYCTNYENTQYPMKYNYGWDICTNCSFSKELQAQVDNCSKEGGISTYTYNEKGCAIELKECNFCNKEFDSAIKEYTKNTFFIYAAIGFALIVIGLFVNLLLIQIILLPAGAFLVIEASLRNFDDKLYIIITFSLLIIAAVLLALKRLR
jgi:hypothetical protein